MLLAGLILGRPLHGAASQVHGELWFGLTASKLDRRRRNQPPMHENRHQSAAMRGCVRTAQRQSYRKNTESRFGSSSAVTPDPELEGSKPASMQHA